jgi:hypothetical protein
MRVTAIRMGDDVWRLLEGEAARVGVSVSQYIREAALSRAAAGAALRGEDPHTVLAQAALSANASEPTDPAMHEPNGEPPAPGESAQPRGRSQRARESARQTRLEAQTERAEKRQSMRRYHG